MTEVRQLVEQVDEDSTEDEADVLLGRVEVTLELVEVEDRTLLVEVVDVDWLEDEEAEVVVLDVLEDVVIDKLVLLEVDTVIDDDTETVLEEELGTTGTAWYIFKRVRPPQYSVVLAAQTILQPLTDGTELVSLTEPAFITLPQ